MAMASFAVAGDQGSVSTALEEGALLILVLDCYCLADYVTNCHLKSMLPKFQL